VEKKSAPVDVFRKVDNRVEWRVVVVRRSRPELAVLVLSEVKSLFGEVHARPEDARVLNRRVHAVAHRGHDTPSAVLAVPARHASIR
jgi:hypothetical protein